MLLAAYLILAPFPCHTIHAQRIQNPIRYICVDSFTFIFTTSVASIIVEDCYFVP